ncbi:MAG: GcrA family cell cycle regulator [Salaquimonas sp.]
MSWTDERVDILRKLWTEGLSASQIAAELGGVTRNAVIGKVHRLGLSGRAKGSNQSTGGRRKTAQAKPAGFTKTSKGTAGTAKPNGAAQAAPRAQPVVDIPKPTPMMLNLLQLTDSTCKFPIGDPQEEDFGFCGAKPRDSDPYCEYHCRLAYQPASERRSRSTRTLPPQIGGAKQQAGAAS